VSEDAPGKGAAGAGTTAALSSKGLGAGTVSLIGAVVIGVSCVAPAYTLTGALGATTAEVGSHVPAIFIVGFIPMLLVAFGYRELSQRMPDSGTSFTWATRAFGPWIGWMAGWGLAAATIVVLSNLAGIAVDFFYLALSQAFSDPGIADWTNDAPLNVLTCLVFMAGATAISYRDMQTTQKLQYGLIGFQVVVLLLFGGVAVHRVLTGSAFDATPLTLDDFNPFGVSSFSAFAAGISLSIFIFWGWDVTLTMSEESKDPERTPGRAATLTVVIIMALYLFLACALLVFAGTGDGAFGLGNPDIQGNVFFFLAEPVLGSLAILVSLAVLFSSAASLQTTFVSPARTLLAMAHYGAMPPSLARIHPRYGSPARATLVSSLVASVFYAVMRFVSYNVLWDTITALGMLICFYYGLTAFACVWYFRRQWFASAHNAFFQFTAPLLGGLVLAVIFVQTLVDSADPSYGSGSTLGGVGLVFLLGVSIIVAGIVVMLVQSRLRPEFFRGGVLPRGVAGDAAEARASLPE
jgi:amino acid transporter